MKIASKVKTRILHTASRLFYQQGYQSTGINQIIAESEVAKASFYSHFATKEDLCATYLSDESKDWFLALEEQLYDEKSIEEKVGALFDHVIDFHIKEQFRGCAFLNVQAEIGQSSTKISNEIRTHKTKLLAFFNQLIPDEKKARKIYIIYEASLMECQVFSDIWPAEQGKELALEIIKLNY